MDTEVFRQYVELARTLNFSKASKQLNIAQPTLSRNIAQLERFVGAQLLVRKRELTITPVGKAVLKYANNIVQQQEHMLAEVKTVMKFPEPLLIIEDVSDLPILSDILNEAFVRIRQRQPHIDIRFKSVHGKSLEEALMNGDLDIGFSWYFPSDHIGQNEGGVNHDEYIESVRIMPYDNEMLIMVPRDNPLAAQASLDIKDLTQLEFYRPVNASFEHYFVSFENICAQHGVTLNYRLIVIESLSDLFYLGHSDCAFLISTSMLKAGAVPRSVLDRIAPVPLSDVDLHWNLYAEWHAHSKNPNIPPFIEQLAAVSEAKA